MSSQQHPVVGQAPRLLLRGQAGGSGRFAGQARVLLSAEPLDRLRPGEVLVTRWATPHLAAVLPLLGGLVTDEGGPLCALATLAREYAVPLVTGTREATTTIVDETPVLVDGERGLVMPVAPHAPAPW